MRLKAVLTLTIGTALVSGPLLAQDFSDVEIQTVPVTDGISMLVGQGGNIGLSVGADGALIIDTQFAPLSDKIRAAVSAAGGGDIRYVINTHWHGDHTGGNANFSNSGAVVMAHANVRTRLAAAEDTDPAALPRITYPDRVSFAWNGDMIELIHVAPAHTDGDTIVHFSNLNAFHMGDTFFNGAYPFVDVDSAGSFSGLIAAGELVLAMADDDTVIIPGHGPLADRDDLAEWIGILKAIRSRFQTLIDAGLDADEVIAAGVTSEWDEAMGAGFMDPETFTRLAHQSLTQ